MIRQTRQIAGEIYELCLTRREIKRAMRLRIVFWDIHGQAWRLTRHARLMRWLERLI